jgi:ethanolamine ammonia-lyase small subunit
MTSPPAASIVSSRDLRDLTPARVGLGRSGVSLPTQALLDFTLDHARARDAVHAPFDAAAMLTSLAAQGFAALPVSSQAMDRKTYLRRPDLGRKLDEESRQRLGALNNAPCDLAIIIGDGLSSAAVHLHAADMAGRLAARFTGMGVTCGPVAVASGARVALGDDIGALLKARMTVTLIGERPGLSAPDSLGCYITYAPKPGLTDAARNCVSNIHAAGLSYDEAAFKIAWLVREAFARKMSGVALKDESGGAPLPHEQSRKLT